MWWVQAATKWQTEDDGSAEESTEAWHLSTRQQLNLLHEQTKLLTPESLSFVPSWNV